jgi:hypothetical protein
MSPDAGSEELIFNGVDLDTGEYLTPPVPLSKLAENVRARAAGGRARGRAAAAPP